MSKYEHGPYHYLHYASGGSDYREHVHRVLAIISENIQPKTIVDMGAGEGLMVDLLSRSYGDKVFGYELDPNALALARGLGNYVLAGDMRDQKPKVDLFLFLDVLEHVEDWQGALKWAIKTAKFIMIAIPDRVDRHSVHNIRLEEIIQHIGSNFMPSYKWQANARDGVVMARIK